MKDHLYFQDIVSSLEKILYYERGRGAYFRATMIGTDFIDRKPIQGNKPEEVIENCIKGIRESHIADHLSFKKEENGTLFTFEIIKCMHLPIEEKLNRDGVPPYVCPPINMILWKIRERVGLAVEIADITVDQDNEKCLIRVVVFKQK